MIPYSPKNFSRPKNMIQVDSAWKGLESIIEDILDNFGIKREKALEFGVWQGYSTVVLSSFFQKVIGVDTFEGDKNAGTSDLSFEEIKKLLSPYPIQLYQKSYQDYIKQNFLNGPYDLVHIDVVHTYEDTFACGDWALQHSNFVIFHDTQSFPDVMLAVTDLSIKHNVEFFNYPYCNGLGILWRPK